MVTPIYGKTSKLFNMRCMGLIVTGDCNGDCCGPLLMTPAEFAKVEHKARSGYRTQETPTGYMLYIYGEHDCPFLRAESRRCRIYPKRPGICRKFGDESAETMCCPHLTKSGNIRTEKLSIDLSEMKAELSRRVLEM